jgi:hypothetical protein
VGLIGITGLRGQPGQVGGLPDLVNVGHEAAEPQHPPQGRRTVAHRGTAPAAQLPLADVEIRRHRFHVHPGTTEAPYGLGHERVGRSGIRHPVSDPDEAAHRHIRRE